MRILSFALFLAGICFCVAGFIGHYAAFTGAVLCFFAAAMIFVRQAKG